MMGDRHEDEIFGEGNDEEKEDGAFKLPIDIPRVCAKAMGNEAGGNAIQINAPIGILNLVHRDSQDRRMAATSAPNGDPQKPRQNPKDIYAKPSEKWRVEISKDENPKATTKEPLRKSVTAVRCPDKSYRVYFQRGAGIYEAKCSKKRWMLSGPLNTHPATENAQLAVILSQSGVNNIHLFYVTEDAGKRFVYELCCGSDGTWSDGTLNQKAPIVSHHSSLAALSNAKQCMLFFQRGDWICQLSYTFSSSTWEYSELSKAKPGTSISAVHYASKTGPLIRLYFQDKGNNLREKVHENLAWGKDKIIIRKAPACTPLAAVTEYMVGPPVRLYHVSDKGHVLEHRFYGGEWTESPYDLSSSAEPVSDDTGISTLLLNGGQWTRLYYLSLRGGLWQMVFSETNKTPHVEEVLA